MSSKARIWKIVQEYGYHQWASPANLAVLRMTAGFAAWMGACVTAMYVL